MYPALVLGPVLGSDFSTSLEAVRKLCWLLSDGLLYIFDEPTKGVDVGARADLPHQIGALAFANKAVVYDLLFKTAAETLRTNSTAGERPA